jgi:hypothetical protein|tara:strand:+ start:10209 stop:10565 length:357 start_codon:yes stop_codon:yes gene_type:complete
MATYSKHLLSGSTNGKNISVTGTSTGASVTVHTATSGTSNLDEIWLYATNTTATARVLTIEFGGTTDQDDLIELEIAADSGMTLIIPGLLLQNSLVVKAFAAAGDAINLNGYVNRITA